MPWRNNVHLAFSSESYFYNTTNSTVKVGCYTTAYLPSYTQKSHKHHYVTAAFLLWMHLSGARMNSEQGYTVDEVQSLSADMDRLFDSGRGCDFTIVVQSLDRNDSDYRVCVHRLILSLNPQSIFFNITQETNNFTMAVPENCRLYVTSFLRYIYTRQINVTISSIQCIYQMASEYGYKSLQAECGRLFSWVLPDDSSFMTTISLYNYAVKIGDPVLQETCLQYLAWNSEALISSEAWLSMNTEAMEAFLSRSDLVVPDESFLLHALESWIKARNNHTESRIVARLLGLIRFPMISAEHLYDIQYTSELYKIYTKVYNEKIVEGYPFQVLSFDQLKTHLASLDAEHTPRIYTAQPWSYNITAAEINSYLQNNYNPYYGMQGSFSTPVLNSAIYQDDTTTWSAVVFLNNQQCSNQGITCDSTPAVRLYQTSYNQYQDIILYSNKIVLWCNDSYVFHVQDLNSTNVAFIPTNSSIGQDYPCLNDQYSYLFVVRPKYIL
ncbi:hypothetical protein Z043-122532 [Arapaima gigas]